MVANIIGMVMVNIGAVLLFDFLLIGVGFLLDLFSKDDPKFVFFGAGLAVVITILVIIVSIILWGIWLIL